MQLSNNQRAFLALLSAGLWEQDIQLSHFRGVDYDEVFRLAEKQSVIGLVSAGLEHVIDVKPPKEFTLQLVGKTLLIEQRNLLMNQFIGHIVEKMREADIYTILVKGQGLAQCYVRPKWRSSGDVDFLLSDSNYKKAIEFLLPHASNSKNGGGYSKEFALTINQWMVELHGTLRTGLSSRVDKEVDEVQKDVFYGGNVRSWLNETSTVFLPSPDNDVFFVFTHFIKHFYKEGMNLRQVCDWCRLLWIYRTIIDNHLLQKRLQRAGLISEWKTFAALAVDYFGMPEEAMPLYDNKPCWRKNAKLIIKLIVNEYKHNVVYDTCAIARIFPLQVIRYSPSIFLNVNGLKIKERLQLQL